MPKRYCECRQVEKGFMVSCNLCAEWFHGTCVNETKQSLEGVDEWFCRYCKIMNRMQLKLDLLTKDLPSASTVHSLPELETVEQDKKHLRKEIEALRHELSLSKSNLDKMNRSSAQEVEDKDNLQKEMEILHHQVSKYKSDLDNMSGSYAKESEDKNRLRKEIEILRHQLSKSEADFNKLRERFAKEVEDEEIMKLMMVLRQKLKRQKVSRKPSRLSLKKTFSSQP